MYCDVCNKKTEEIYIAEFPTGRRTAICEECLPALQNIGIEPWITKAEKEKENGYEKD